MASSTSLYPEELFKVNTGKFNRWTQDETKLLIAEWSEPHIQAGLRDMKRNSSIFNDLRLEQHGYFRSPQQIKLKLKNLKKEYFKVKNYNNTSGHNAVKCEFYEELDEILGSRDIVTTVTFDSLKENENTESSETFEETTFDIVLQTTSESDTTDTPILEPVTLDKHINAEKSTSRNTRLKKRKYQYQQEWIERFIEYDQAEKQAAKSQEGIRQEMRIQHERELAEKEQQVIREENEKNRILLENMNQRELEHEASMMKMFTDVMLAMAQSLKK